MADDYKQLQQTNPSLLRRMRSGKDENAWNEFDALYRPMLARFAKARGLADADVEDVVQHCMTAVLMNIESFTYDPQRGRFKSWLRTLVNNRCRDVQRASRTANVERRELDHLPGHLDSPEVAFEKIWADEHLNHCLQKMRREVDDATFTAFHRYVLEANPVDEVCRDLQLSPNQLYKIKHRLTGRLRELMQALLGESFKLGGHFESDPTNRPS